MFLALTLTTRNYQNNDRFCNRFLLVAERQICDQFCVDKSDLRQIFVERNQSQNYDLRPICKSKKNKHGNQNQSQNYDLQPNIQQ